MALPIPTSTKTFQGTLSTYGIPDQFRSIVGRPLQCPAGTSDNAPPAPGITTNAKLTWTHGSQSRNCRQSPEPQPISRAGTSLVSYMLSALYAKTLTSVRGKR
eukprot:4425891-Pyramimonas_sp.AAC.1